ncbi:MAG: alkaline phosphatase family protein [Bdellovibrionaceae bacterium]|nr:alkaline phosphatase family protein [Pseudobdellovibrionaceae bacterium]NUM57156.1 alkaline phosphatase family protein [Pseudobdellovibrionaceae bacterium]
MKIKNHLQRYSISTLSLFSLFFSTLIIASNAQAANATISTTRPKLVVFLVFDQLRADYLLKYKEEFVKNSSSKLGGFNYLLENGSYYPYAEYNVLQNMTCPGHAMISTGSWPINTGISLNEWYDKETKKTVYCVEDEKYDRSPRRLATTTLSDEFKALDIPSKVFGVALKDRSGIMLSGRKADGVFWFNEKNWQWETSKFYKDLPTWMGPYNSKISKIKGEKKWLASKWGVEATINLGQEIILNEKLGKNKGTDFLFMSFSTHDIAGHTYGPNSKEMKELTLAEDLQIARFMNFMRSKFQLSKDVLFVLTADHGIPASIEYSNLNKVEAEFINEIEVIEKIYSELNKMYSPKEKQEWFSSFKSLHYYANDVVLEKLSINKKEFLETCRKIILKQNQLEEVLIPSSFTIEKIINPQLRAQVDNSFVGHQWGDLILVPRPYSMNKSQIVLVNHLTGYVYDRTVPLILVGDAFRRQTFYQKAYIVDIAPTVSAVLHSLPGAKSDGRILYETFRN